jgi:hypothetical protein
MENISGMMAELIKATGWKTICTAKEYTCGLMAVSTKASI